MYPIRTIPYHGPHWLQSHANLRVHLHFFSVSVDNCCACIQLEQNVNSKDPMGWALLDIEEEVIPEATLRPLVLSLYALWRQLLVYTDPSMACWCWLALYCLKIAILAMLLLPFGGCYWIISDPSMGWALKMPGRCFASRCAGAWAQGFPSSLLCMRVLKLLRQFYWYTFSDTQSLNIDAMPVA